MHFQLPGHSKHHLEMIGLERIRGGIAVRKIRERAYIRKHQLVSTGLNVRDRENLANFQFSKKNIHVYQNFRIFSSEDDRLILSTAHPFEFRLKS